MDHLLVGGIAFVVAIIAMVVHCFYFPELITVDIEPESDNIGTNDQGQSE